MIWHCCDFSTVELAEIHHYQRTSSSTKNELIPSGNPGVNSGGPLGCVCIIRITFPQVAIVFNLFITYGDTFLPNPHVYDELYYELIRMHNVFENLYSLGKYIHDIHTQTHTNSHTHTHKLTHTHTHIHKLTHTHAHIHTHTYTNSHTCTQTHTYTHTHTHIYTHSHIYRTWREELLVNLANLWQFAKFLPSKCLSFTIQIACKSKFANILPSKS